MTKQFRITTGQKPNFGDNTQVFDEDVYISGTLNVSGGISSVADVIAQNVHVSGNLDIDGDLFVSGTVSNIELQNNTGTTTTIGEVVYISGDNVFDTAINNGSISERRIVGFTAEEIPPGSTGKIIFNGVVPIGATRQIGNNWTAGDPIYLDSSNNLTTTPDFSKEVIRVGYCLNTPGPSEDALLSINIDARDRAPVIRLTHALPFDNSNGGPDYGTPVYIDLVSGNLVAAQSDDNSKNLAVGLLNHISASSTEIPFVINGTSLVTSSIQNGTDWSTGDTIYLNTTGGTLTNTEPTKPGQVKAQIGFVLEHSSTDLKTGISGSLIQMKIKTPEVIGADATVSLVNNIGATCTRGQAVYLDGDETFNLADANSFSTSKVVGFNPLFDISNNSTGSIATEGVVAIPWEQQNGANWIADDTIYLSTVSGALTNLRPTGSGEIECKVGVCSNTPTLDEDAYLILRIEEPKQNIISVTSFFNETIFNANQGRQFKLTPAEDTEIQIPISGTDGDVLTLSVDNVNGNAVTFHSGVQNYGQLDVSTVSGSKSIVTLTGRDYGSGLVWGRHVTHSENLFNGITDIDVEVTTSNSTPTTIASYSTQADNSMYLFDLSFSMVDGTDGHVFERYLRSTFYRDNLSAVTQSNLNTISNYADDVSWDAYLEESGTDILIRVVGDSSNTTNIRLKGVAIATES